MDLQAFLLSEAELSENGVSAAPDDLTGTPAAEVKALFDRLPRKLAERLNGALTELAHPLTGAVGRDEAAGSYLARTAVSQSLGISADRVPSEFAVTQAIGSAGGGDMMQSVYDSDGDGTVNRAAAAAAAENGLYPLTHGFQTGPGQHKLTGTVPGSGAFTVCFQAAKTYAASHQSTVVLNGTVRLSLVSPGHTSPQSGCFEQGELVTGTVVLSSATAGTLYLSSVQPVHRSGGRTAGSLIVGGYTLNEGSTVVASVTTGQVRNVTLSTEAPTGGTDGDLWLQYTP